MSLKEKIVRNSPYFIQNLAVTLFNVYQYSIRHGGDYKYFREFYKNAENLSKDELEQAIEVRKQDFLTYVKNSSEWYKKKKLDDFNTLSVLQKEDILNHLDKIKTIDESEGVISLTGGTTGASMKVIYTKKDMQERFAILDHFRYQHGYELGKKTAWFSGKNLITQKDIDKGICSHYDFVNKIRFYSTFLINEKNFDIYWKSLNEFDPEFLVGFPSSVFEICQIARNRGLKYKGKAKVFFPTAETVLLEYREVISEVLGCKLVDQYASSEGAPFILECSKGGLHIHPLTGIFEVLDDDLQPSQEGQLIVTSFTTYGTPLIRYKIGDSISLADANKKCKCGSIFPLVESIQGRTNDYILSPDFGKINLGNISNSTKDAQGIICFQLIQNEIDSIDVNLVVNDKYNKNQENKFISALRERIGENIKLNFKYLDEIPKEKSGKFRIVKNNIGQ
ncbi:phenylacetate--CoA ligase family protein [Acinetobacter variabilis]|uniref:phenylacetate--CoA ligase family protein n=1 Tax=Acinetobacter variabilis TaxID=70346 RepID=UPI00289AF3E2|nr:phenylacetate--CoA ligase family protein [Acinetobacter variabilis]